MARITDAREFSREKTFFQEPTIDVLKVGALVRIADALEGVLQELRDRNPHRRKMEGHRAQKKEKHTEVERWLVINDCARANPIAWAFVEICGVDADHTNMENWVVVMDRARKSIGGFGMTAESIVRKLIARHEKAKAT